MDAGVRPLWPRQPAECRVPLSREVLSGPASLKVDALGRGGFL